MKSPTHKTERKNRWFWIEEYEGCGCSEEADRKSDLLGYCAKHGSDKKNRYKVLRPELATTL